MSRKEVNDIIKTNWKSTVKPFLRDNFRYLFPLVLMLIFFISTDVRTEILVALVATGLYAIIQGILDKRTEDDRKREYNEIRNGMIKDSLKFYDLHKKIRQEVENGIEIEKKLYKKFKMQAEYKLIHEYYKVNHGTYGIDAVFPERGGTELDDLISSAQKRIWAVGLTNTTFASRSALLKSFKETPNIDIVICFLTEYTRDITTKIKDINQAKIDTEMFISTIEKVKRENNNGGRLRVLALKSNTYFTSVLIDNTTLFFPYLFLDEEHQPDYPPSIQVDATKEIGQLIDKHYTFLFSGDCYLNKDNCKNHTKEKCFNRKKCNHIACLYDSQRGYSPNWAWLDEAHHEKPFASF